MIGGNLVCRRCNILLFLFLIFPIIANASDDLGDVTVRLTGKLGENVSRKVSVKSIESIGIETIDKYDPFNKKVTQFSGVRVKAFVAKYATPDVGKVVFTAIDDYQISFTRKEWEEEKVFLVTRVEGKHIGLEQRGPLRIILPEFDQKIDNSKESLPRWIWMIKKVRFE